MTTTTDDPHTPLILLLYTQNIVEGKGTRYNLMEELGRGKTAVVRLARREDGKDFAVKCFFSPDEGASDEAAAHQDTLIRCDTFVYVLTVVLRAVRNLSLSPIEGLPCWAWVLTPAPHLRPTPFLVPNSKLHPCLLLPTYRPFPVH
jgi:hypothetical protein